MRRHVIAGSILLVLVVAGVVLVWPSSEPPAVEETESPARDPAPRLEGASATEPPRTAPTPSPTPPSIPKTERVRGTLRVDGVAPARFTVQVEGDDPRRSRPFRIDGTDGAFDSDAVPRGRSRLRIVKIDGRDVDLPLARGAGDVQSLEVVGDPLVAALIVVDRATKAPLNTARALRWDGAAPPQGVMPPFEHRETIGPRDGRAQGAKVGGRIELPPSSGRGTWLVVDDTHAWKAVEVRYGEPDQTVELDHGGRAQITVVGWREVQDAAVLWMRIGDGALERLPWLDYDGRTWIDGIPLGEYEVVLLAGAADGAPVLASAPVSVRYEQPAEVTLDARARSAGRGRIVLTFEYGPEWVNAVGQQERMHATFAGIDAETKHVSLEAVAKEPGQPDRPNRIVSDPLPAGAYRIEGPFGWRGEATVVDGDVRVDARLPEPGRIECSCRDAVTRAPVPGASVWWKLEGFGQASIGSSADGGLVTLRVVPGRLVIWAKGRAYRQSAESTLDVRPGQTVRTEIALEPERRLTVAIRDGTVPLADARWAVSLESEGATGKIVERRQPTGPSSVWYDVGFSRAVVRIEPPAGYETPEPRTIDLGTGLNEVVFDLVRKR